MSAFLGVCPIFLKGWANDDHNDNIIDDYNADDYKDYHKEGHKDNQEYNHKEDTIYIDMYIFLKFGLNSVLIFWIYRVLVLKSIPLEKLSGLQFAGF